MQIPYIHWERKTAVLEMANFLRKSVLFGVETGSTNVNYSARRHREDQPQEISIKHRDLLYSYLSSRSPLHNRRTLDQYRYYNLLSTTERDQDQLFSRVVLQDRSVNPVLMVDQLWLWRLPDGECHDAIQHYYSKAWCLFRY